MSIDDLNPKARRILRVIAAGGRLMTRADIAAQLDQTHLYAYDLRILKELEQSRMIVSQRRRRHDLLIERDEEYRFMFENFDRIWGGNRKLLRWGRSAYVWEYQVSQQLRGALRR